jgi:hypothetical protein
LSDNYDNFRQLFSTLKDMETASRTRNVLGERNFGDNLDNSGQLFQGAGRTTPPGEKLRMDLREGRERQTGQTRTRLREGCGRSADNNTRDVQELSDNYDNSRQFLGDNLDNSGQLFQGARRTTPPGGRRRRKKTNRTKGDKIAGGRWEGRRDERKFGACGREGRGSRVNGSRTPGKSGGQDGHFDDLRFASLSFTRNLENFGLNEGSEGASRRSSPLIFKPGTPEPLVRVIGEASFCPGELLARFGAEENGTWQSSERGRKRPWSPGS